MESLKKAQAAGLKVKPEAGIRFGAGRATSADQPEEEYCNESYRWIIFQRVRFADGD